MISADPEKYRRKGRTSQSLLERGVRVDVVQGAVVSNLLLYLVVVVVIIVIDVLKVLFSLAPCCYLG